MTGVHVFGNAWDYMYFDETNCCQCALYSADGDQCELQGAIMDGAVGDGLLPSEIARRLGWTEAHGIPRQCAEFAPDSAAQTE